jgi:hypothetical protein
MKNILIILALLTTTQAQACMDKDVHNKPISVSTIKNVNNTEIIDSKNPVVSLSKNEADSCWTPTYLQDELNAFELPHSKLEVDIGDENICGVGYIHSYEINLFYKKYKKSEDVTFLHKNNEITVFKSNECIEKVIIKPKTKKYNIITNKNKCKDIDKYVFVKNDYEIQLNGKKLENLTDDNYFFHSDFIGSKTLEALLSFNPMILKYFLYSLLILIISMFSSFKFINFISKKLSKD